MTMRVEIKNTDASRSCRIVVRHRHTSITGQSTMEPVREEATVVLPGDTGNVWLHNGQDCILEEV